VQCQLDRHNDYWSVGDVREVLDTLPRTLYGTYDRIIDAIERTEFGPRIARRALLWLVLALEPLTLSQLAEVLSINSDEPSWDVSNAPMHRTDILEICGSLVIFDENNRIVTLSHYSVKVCSRILNGLWEICDLIYRQEYLTSDAAAKSPYFVHRLPSGSKTLRPRLKLTSVSDALTVPVALEPRYPHPPKTVFDVWDEDTPATQPGGKGQLAVAELTPRELLSVEFRHGHGSSDYFELEFFPD
jgi:hypothetical protein